MQKITVTIDGSKAPDEAMEEAARTVARLGSDKLDKIGITFSVDNDTQADKLRNALFEQLGKLHARLKMTIKTATEEQVWGAVASVAGETPVERAIRRTKGSDAELGPFATHEYETDEDDEPLIERRA